ncbi:hypothetical protein GCM10023189_44560 [Nibrella saemangeumensis]|uniref:Toprim-like n=1 Tax=Nibrella saemangeumensis TaxID=1084526 RepID=A0ABP8NG91_9BACT
MTKFDELKQRYPNLIPVQELRDNVSILELAAHYGYEPLPHKGKGRPVLMHPIYRDTIIIKNPEHPGQQIYQRSGDFADSGTIIDFIRNRLTSVFSAFNHPGNHEFRNITGVLYDYLRIDPDQVARNRQRVADPGGPVVKQPFAKELFDIRPLEVNNYLQKRYIAQSIAEGPEFTGKAVTQVAYLNPETGHTEDFLTVKANPDRKYITFSNVAFPYYNGLSEEVMGFEIRNEQIKQHAPGSDRHSSVFVSNAPPETKRFMVMESVLDAMAHKQLRMIQGDNAFDTLYFSTGGQLTPEQVNTISRYTAGFQKAADWRISLAFDNDAKGHRYDLQFIQQLSAAQFPMSATVAGLGRVGYQLPEGDVYRPLVNQLLERIDLFNQEMKAQVGENEGKELSGQLIIVGQKGEQTAISIPETCVALRTMNNVLLELAGLSQRVSLEKSSTKDFTDDLKREVELGAKYAYGIIDQDGANKYNSNSALNINRTLKLLEQQVPTEGHDHPRAYQVVLRMPDGSIRPQAELFLEKGKVVRFTQEPEFKRQLLEEKASRGSKHQPDPRSEVKAVNPEDKPQKSLLPEQPEKHPQKKMRH